MTSHTDHSGSVSNQAQNAADSEWVKLIGRVGLAAKGLVYILVGYIALQIAFGATSTQANQQGAFQTLTRQPGGTLVLWLVVVGLLGYALWRFTEAYTGPRDETDDKKRAAKRAISVIRGVVYLGFAYVAAHIALTSNSESTSSTAAGIMKSTGGQLLVGLVGAGIVIAGVAMLVQGWRVDFEEELDTSRMSPTVRKVIIALGRFGYLARGVVFSLAGGWVVNAAVNFNPKQANGLDVALRQLGQAPFGQFMLTVVAIGLIAFGLYSFTEVRYRRL